MRKIIIIVTALILGLLSLLCFEFPFNLLRPVFHTDTIQRYARRYELDPLLVTALIKVESNFLRRARSHRGAVGLMQLLPSTAGELAVELNIPGGHKLNLEDPEVNIRIGTYYLSRLNREFEGNTILALAAYNAGKTKVQRWYVQNPLIGIDVADIPYPETRAYVTNILRTYSWLKKIQGLKNLLRGKKI